MPLSRTVLARVLLLIAWAAGCEGSRDSAPTAPSRAPGAVSGSSTPPPSTPPPPAPSRTSLESSAAPPSVSLESSAAPAPVSVSSLRAAAARDPAAFERVQVSLDGFFVRVSQKRFGTGEHPIHTWAAVRVALERGAADTIECEMPESRWPPPGLQPGDAIRVTGMWSFDRTLSGGVAPGGGPLHVVGCAISRGSAQP